MRPGLEDSEDDDATAMDLPRRRGRPVDRTIEPRVLEAVVDLMTETGLADFTLEEVAERANTNKMAIHRRWPTKALLQAAALKRFAATIELPDTGSVADDIAELLENHVAGYGHGRATLLVPLAFEAVSKGVADEATVESVREFATARRRPFVDAIARGQARGEIRDDIEPDVAVDLLLGALWARLFGFLPLEEGYGAKVAAAALNGLRTRKP